MNWFQCEECGRFIPYRDIESGEATHYLIYPDSAYTSETYETTCARCNKKHTTNKEANWPIQNR